jgi:hypothetical protein
MIAAWKSAADIRSSRAISCTVSLGFWIRRAAPPARFPTSARGEPSDSRPCEDMGRTFDLAARFNHGASEPGLKCLGRNRLFRHDPHLDKLRPNASHRLRDPCVEGRVHRRQPEFRGRDSEPAARRQQSARSADWLNQNGAAPLEMSLESNSLPRPNARRGAEN